MLLSSFFWLRYCYIRMNTTDGYRYLYYTPTNHNYGVSSYDNPHYIHHGLGKNDGEWKTFTRDLDADLKRFDPDNSIISVDGFFIRASGMIDDIILLKEKTESIATATEAIDAWLAHDYYYSFSLRTQAIVFSDDLTRAVVYLASNMFGGSNGYMEFNKNRGQ